MFTSDDVRRSYIDFFTARGHVEIPGASLVPEGDSSVLFTIAGIQPLVPYFGGAPHPAGRRLVDYQRCLRTLDIEEVGDASHLTCFEMLGNWSLGDYYKRESIAWTLEWLVDVLGLPRDRLSVTIYEGDDEARSVWESLGMTRIRELGREDNWWGPPGPHGPCGPDSEVFYDDLEIGNNVFIAYEQRPDGSLSALAQRNVDVGLGFERIVGVLQGVDSVYETDLFVPVAGAVRELASVGDTRAERIVCDHLRSAVLLIGDGVLPSNSLQGYVLRRLLRRAIRQGRTLGIEGPFLRAVGESVLDRYATVYPGLSSGVLDVLEAEETQFTRTLQRGLREIARLERIDGRELFRLFETYGLPPELHARGARHRPARLARRVRRGRLRAPAAQPRRRRKALPRRPRRRLPARGPPPHRHAAARRRAARSARRPVHRRGSSITDARLRLDFSHPERLSDEQLAAVEARVNEWIAEGIDVERLELPREEASSKELSRGPHVANTREVGNFRIVKQEASSAGVRRIKATVE